MKTCNLRSNYTSIAVPLIGYTEPRCFTIKIARFKPRRSKLRLHSTQRLAQNKVN